MSLVVSKDGNNPLMLIHLWSDPNQKMTYPHPVPEIQGSTKEVAYAKVQRAAEILQGPCITEDTALCFKALGGLPGPFIKYFLKELGHDGASDHFGRAALRRCRS